MKDLESYEPHLGDPMDLGALTSGGTGWCDILVHLIRGAAQGIQTIFHCKHTHSVFG